MPRHIDRPLDDPPHLDYRTLPGQSSVPLEPRVSGNFIPRVKEIQSLTYSGSS